MQQRYYKDFDVWEPYHRFASEQGVREQPSRDYLRLDGTGAFIAASERALWVFAYTSLDFYLKVIEYVPAIIQQSSHATFHPLENVGTGALFSVRPDSKLDGQFRYRSDEAYNHWYSQKFAIADATVYAMGYQTVYQRSDAEYRLLTSRSVNDRRVIKPFLEEISARQSEPVWWQSLHPTYAMEPLEEPLRSSHTTVSSFDGVQVAGNESEVKHERFRRWRERRT